MPQGDADRFILFLHENPTLMRPVRGSRTEVKTLRVYGPGYTENQLRDMRRSESHMCLKCGKVPCGMVVIADHPFHGRYWLDLCHGCVKWIREASSPMPHR